VGTNVGGRLRSITATRSRFRPGHRQVRAHLDLRRLALALNVRLRTVPDLRDDFRELPDTPPQWVRPTLVVEVEYRQRLRDGLRHVALKGIRPDKKPRMIRRSVFR
jgi:hypothetical protein